MYANDKGQRCIVVLRVIFVCYQTGVSEAIDVIKINHLKEEL